MDAYESDPKAPEAAPQSPEQALLSQVPTPVYPEYFAPSDDDVKLAKAQPLPLSVSPTALSQDYVSDFKPFEEEEEEPYLWSSSHHLCQILLPHLRRHNHSRRDFIPPLLLPSPIHRDMIPKVDMPPQKRARSIAPSRKFEIRESSVAVSAGQPGSALTRGTELGFMTALEEVKESVTDIVAKHRQDNEDFHTRYKDA
uniref:Uncharacterized protein n=1 Tax=Tanacetum cinerariifolium TaxID=118510 RepID=A0A6L2N4F8_TANCI|nr:hypothetical protein [Tanacetum cinerariifolium]